MKKINFCKLSVIIFALITAISAVTYAKITQSNIADSLLRLHIVANSDSDIDQRLKIAVRDRILREAGYLFENTESLENAEQLAEENLDRLIEIAKSEAESQGYSYLVKGELVEEAFPVKFYDDIMLPSGKYTALKITIGEGKGKNWWCVMYPPMCSLEGITMDTGRQKLEKSLSAKEYEMISSHKKEAEIRFKFVDIINSIL